MRPPRQSPFASQGGSGFTGTGPGAGLQLPPWERRDRFGFLNALYMTVKDVLLAPGRMFACMPAAAGWQQPLLFAITVGAIGAFLGWLWAMTGSSLQILVQENLGHVLRGPFFAFLVFVFSPVLVTVSTTFQAAVIHGALMLLGGNRLGFEATFRVCAYTSAIGLLAAIPLCGNVLAVIWEIVVLIIGIRAIHQAEPWQAVLAVLLPMILWFGIIGGSLVMLMALT